MQGFKASTDQLPRKRSAAVTAKAAALRSQDARGVLPAADAAAEAEAERAAAKLAARAAQWRQEQVCVPPCC